ncbi:hypothetical protein COOONC_09784 [Cooperia oncophora]
MIELNRLLQAIKSYGVWPMVDGDDKWRVENFDLTSLMIFVREKRGFDVFIVNGVLPDNKNVSRRLIKSYGVWPMVDGDDKWRVENFDLTSLMIYVSEKRGLDVFIATDVSLDDKNVSRRLIQVRTVSEWVATDGLHY